MKIEDKCLSDILNFKEAHCKMQSFNKQEITEIIPGVLVFKNFNGNISHNCNRAKLKINGNFLIKFENCEIITFNKTFTNVKIKLYDKFILPNLITKIKEDSNTTLADLKLESLYIKQIKHEEAIKEILYHNNKSNVIYISSHILIILTIIVITLIFVYLMKHRLSILHISSEPQSNGGGVTMSPNIPLTRVNII